MEPYAQYSVSKRLEENKQKYQDLSLSRDISRRAILTIITLSSTIIGATFTLYSIPNLQERFNINAIIQSWVVFVVTIALGLLYLIIDGRLLYFETWEKGDWGSHGIPMDKTLRKISKRYTLLSLLWPDFRDRGYSKIIAITGNNSNFDDYSKISASYYRNIRAVVLGFELVIYIVFVLSLVLLIISFHGN